MGTAAGCERGEGSLRGGMLGAAPRPGVKEVQPAATQGSEPKALHAHTGKMLLKHATLVTEAKVQQALEDLVRKGSAVKTTPRKKFSHSDGAEWSNACKQCIKGVEHESMFSLTS